MSIEGRPLPGLPEWRGRTGRFAGRGAHSACALACLVSLTAAAPALADSLENPVEIHGFVSQGFIKTTKNNYLAESERGSFEMTESGVNLTKVASDKLSIGVQLFAQDLGPIGNYRPRFDWYYVDYQFRDWLGFRAGRTKLPFGLYHETADIDAARVPVLLPQSVYPVQNREFLLAQTGAELYGRVTLGAAGHAEYRAYGGSLHVDRESFGPQFTKTEIPVVLGARLAWLPPLDGLTLAGSYQKLRFDIDQTLTPQQIEAYRAGGLLPEGFGGVLELRYPISMWVASLEYQADDLLFAAEFLRFNWDYETSLLAPSFRQVNEGYYAMLSYRVRPWFTPGIYYSVLHVHFEGLPIPGPTGPITYQHDVALTLRYDLSPNWLLKLEGHYMHGTADLRAELNDGVNPNDLEEDWATLLIKTTAYF